MAKVEVQVHVSTSLHYRSGPSTSYKVLGYLKNGEKYVSSKQSNGWYFLDAKGGWSSGSYLKVTKTFEEQKTVPVPKTDDTTTTAAASATKDKALDAKVLNMMLESVKAREGKIDASMRLFGAPHQFTQQTDFRITGGKYDLGRKYLDTMIAESPIVYLMPGRPNFLPNLATEEKDALKEFFKDTQPGEADNKEVLNKVLGNKDVRYFDFLADYTNYMKYVNILCRTAAIFMGIGDTDAPVDAKRTKYKWFDWSNYRYDESYKVKGHTVNSPFDVKSKDDAKDLIYNSLFGNWQYTQFYVDPRTSFSESSSNQTADSKLKGILDMGQGAMKEISFFMQTGGMGNLDAWGKNTNAEINKALEGLGNNGILGRLTDVGTSIMSGSNIILPEIWGDAAYNKSYNITINLTSPYGHKEAIYLNVIVPLMHLLALSLPRQTSANAFTTPFLVKASAKGWFNCEMGIIDNISIEKVAGSWSVDGLPTEVKVQLSIKDLYSNLMITPATSPQLFFENKGLMNWLAVTCGVDVTQPAFFEKWLNILYTLLNSAVDIPGNIYLELVEKVRGALGPIFSVT
jgi:hypothetical protein